MFSWSILILSGLVVVTANEHLFESLLQRRAKPIRWKWNNDLENLIKPPDVQRRRRFLPEPKGPVMEKWWRTMTPTSKDAVGTKEEVDEAFFSGRPSRGPQMQRLAETSVKKEKENVLVVNSTRTSFREETSFQDRGEFGGFETLSLPVEPFDKDSHVLIAAHYLSPTEKTSFFGGGQRDFPGTFGGVQGVPRQREVEGEEGYYAGDGKKGPPFAPDVDGEFLREAIIHERHKPSKYEKLTASQRLRDSSGRHPGGDRRTASTVEYIVPSVEHVVSHVEYADDNASSSGESQVPPVLPSVEYVTPAVEFVEPEVEYFNSTRESESSGEVRDENPWAVEEEPEVYGDGGEEGSLPDGNGYTLERYNDVQGLKAESDGTRLRIVGLRREQIRVRRNHRKSLQLGVASENYPSLEALPVVQFYCGDFMPGYYVDITTRCQVFHICHDNGQRSSFLCPVGTLFNQEYLVCDWWYNVDCESSSRYYNRESLQAYSTNEKQSVSSQTLKAKDNPRKQTTSTFSAPYPSDINNSRSKLSSSSQKSVNYPVGYAILLREYMKNTMVTDEDAEQQQYYINDKHDAGSRNPKFVFEETPPPFETYGENPGSFRTAKHHRNVSEYPENNSRYAGGSKPYVILPSTHRKPQNQESEAVVDFKPYHYTSYNLSPFRNRDASRSDLGDTSHGKIASLEKEKKSSSLAKEKLKNIHTNSKAAKDLNRYRFIIDPKEAIRPASGKQYSVIKQHIKNNITAIKFRHAESTIKHIPPQNSGNNRRVPKIEEQHHIGYSSPVGFSRDHLASNSDPGITKTSNRSPQFGDRLFIKSKPVFSSEEQIYEYFPESKERNSSSVIEGGGSRVYFNNINQLKNNLNRNNQSYASELLLSESRSDLAKSNKSSDTLLYAKEEKVIGNSGNKTEYFYFPKHKESDLDNQKITISVRIERKAVSKENNNISSNKNKLSAISGSNKTPVFNHESFKTFASTKSQLNASPNPSTNFTSMMYNLSQNDNLNRIIAGLNSQNVTKVNNTHGGYVVAKLPKLEPNETLDAAFSSNRITAVNANQQLQMANNGTSMGHIVD